MLFQYNVFLSSAIPRNEDDIFQWSVMCSEMTQEPIIDMQILLYCGQIEGRREHVETSPSFSYVLSPPLEINGFSQICRCLVYGTALK